MAESSKTTKNLKQIKMKKFFSFFGTSQSFLMFYYIYVLVFLIGADFYDKEIGNNNIFLLIVLTGIVVTNKIEDTLKQK